MDRPTAAPASWPYNHRNMAQVMADETAEDRMRRALARTAPTWNKEPSNGSIRPNKIEDE